jgi:serine/threonine-protein kinase
MDYLEGETLSAVLSREGPLAKARILQIARGIADGLDKAHKQGIIHRDLKPANIMIVGGRAVIMDFGLAKPDDAEAGGHSQTGMLAGSPDYMAPEQFLAEAARPAADIFAFGVILHEMTAGARPYPRETVMRMAVRRVTGAPAPLLEAAPGAPRHWEGALRRAMDRDPSRRYASAEALVRELEGDASTTRMVMEKLGDVRPSRRSFAALGGGLFFLSAAAVFYRYRKRALPSAPLIMMTPVASTASPETARSLDVQIEKGLIQSAHATLVPADRELNAWRLMGHRDALPVHPDGRTAREIGMRSVANFLLSSDL